MIHMIIDLEKLFRNDENRCTKYKLLDSLKFDHVEHGLVACGQ